MNEKEKSGHMLDIWFFVSLILILYGIILMGTGFYYLFIPYERTILSEMHPNLWWGGIMFLTGIIFRWISWRARKEESEA